MILNVTKRHVKNCKHLIYFSPEGVLPHTRFKFLILLFCIVGNRVRGVTYNKTKTMSTIPELRYVESPLVLLDVSDE